MRFPEITPNTDSGHVVIDWAANVNGGGGLISLFLTAGDALEFGEAVVKAAKEAAG